MKPDTFDNDELFFAEEESKEPSTTEVEAPLWKVLVVDDDENVHAVTHMVLADFTFEGRKVELLDAYSGKEGKALLGEHPDIAVIMLDVVMERDDSGLRLSRHIREVMGNRNVRIVLRTGFPGMAPPSKVLIDYDINDYVEKNELTAQRLVMLLIASLRAYRDLSASTNLASRLREEIEEREQAQEKLRASEEMYSAIFTNIGIGVTLLSPKMEILFMNPVMKRLNPHIRVEERPLCFKSFNIPPREDICSYCPTIKTFRDGEVHIAVTDTPTPVGICNYRLIATPVFAEDGTVSSVIEVAEDVTERKQGQERLSRSEAYLQGIIEATADGIVAIDGNGKIIKANNRFAELWNISQDLLEKGDEAAVLECILGQLVDPEAFLLSLGASNQQVKRVAERIRCKDGRVFERIFSPLVRGGETIGKVCSFRDITHKLKMEEEIIRAQKLESVGLLAGGIAHDFNNLLTVVLGNISMAKVLSSTSDKVTARLAEAEKAALRSRELTQQLLTFASGGAPVRRSALVTELLRDTVGFALSGSKVRCELTIDSALPPVEIDEGQISQVLHNLIINADQSMPEGGTIRIFCTQVRSTLGEAPSLAQGNYVRITISDEGVGIPEEHLARVFDPYFTTKETGRGLGLASAYSIIRNHDGLITVASRTGGGTTFTIYLPASTKEPKVKRIEDGPLEIGSGRILIMDDEEGILEIAGEILNHLGFTAEFARNGEEAAELFQRAVENGNPFQAVICDLTIPGGVGGREIVRDLHAIDPQAKMIVSSGYSNNAVMSEYRSHGFDGVIVKPYRLEEVGRVLAETLGRG